MDDHQLLKEYAATNSDAAFRTLVERYTGMVYHTALRQTGNPHDAEEATQTVFIVLARKAGAIPRQTLLYGWLFRATRFAVLNQLRRKTNRERHEQEAMAMQSDETHHEPESIWDQISVHLNDALESLSTADRELVMTRFFGNQSNKDIATTFGISEETARKRLSRAMDKLRDIFARRGIAITSVALMAALAANGAQAAPAGLVASVASLATAKAVTSTSVAYSSAQGVLKLMVWTKVKFVAIALLGLVAVGITATALLTSPSHPLQLPSAVKAQLEKQKSALHTIYLEFTDQRIGINSSYAGETTNYVYFDGSHFYRREQRPDWEHEYSFDGNIVYHLQRSSDRRPSFITKLSLTDTGDPFHYYKQWDFPYLEGASLHTPMVIPDLIDYAGLEPLPLYCLERGELTKMQSEGENLRITFQVPDSWLLNAKHFDVEQVRKQANNGANSQNFVNGEVEGVRRWQSMKPVRIISFLLDASHGFSVAERDEWTAAGEQIVHVVSEDWQYFDDPGIWLPGKCIASYFTAPLVLANFSDQPVLTLTHQLQLAKFGPKDISFVLNSTKPGTRIMDRTTSAARTARNHTDASVINSNGLPTHLVAHAAPLKPAAGRSFIWPLTIGLTLLGALILFFWQRL